MTAADANRYRKLNAPAAGDLLRRLTQAGAKLRGRLEVTAPQNRAALFVAIEAARAAAQVTAVALCFEAGVSRNHYSNLVAAHGRGVSARFLLALWRALKTLEAADAARRDLEQPPIAQAAWRTCLREACAVDGLALDIVEAQLARRGQNSCDANWLAAARARRLALYLASTELGLRAPRLAALTGLTPAAVSIALGKIEGQRDDAEFDRAVDAAADRVRGAA